MFMHRLVVAEVADLGQLRMHPHTGGAAVSPESSRGGYSTADIRPIRGFGTKIRIFA